MSPGDARYPSEQVERKTYRPHQGLTDLRRWCLQETWAHNPFDTHADQQIRPLEGLGLLSALHTEVQRGAIGTISGSASDSSCLRPDGADMAGARRTTLARYTGSAPIANLPAHLRDAIVEQQSSAPWRELWRHEQVWV